MPLILSLKSKLKKFFYYTPVNPYFISKINLLKAMKYSSSYSKGLILDLGCGKKPYEKYFKSTNSKYYGIDYPDYKISKKFSMDIFADVQKLPIKSKTTDTIICNQVLEHIPNSFNLFYEFNRVLKKDGILILTVPFFWGLHEEPRDYYRFTKYGLEYLCVQNGFAVISIKKLGGIFGTIVQRLSDHVIQSLKVVNNRLIIIAIPLTFCLQIFGFILDLIFRNYGDNLDWLLIAKKK